MKAKKIFVKPEMMVCELKTDSELLINSHGQGGETDPWEQ